MLQGYLVGVGYYYVCSSSSKIVYVIRINECQAGFIKSLKLKSRLIILQ